MLFLAITGVVYIMLTIFFCAWFFIKIDLHMDAKTTHPREDLKDIYYYLVTKRKLYLLTRKIDRINQVRKMKEEIEEKTEELKALQNIQPDNSSSEKNDEED